MLYYFCVEETKIFRILWLFLGIYDRKRKEEEWFAKISLVGNSPSSEFLFPSLFYHFKDPSYLPSSRSPNSCFYWRDKNVHQHSSAKSLSLSAERCLWCVFVACVCVCVCVCGDQTVGLHILASLLGQRGQQKSPGEPYRLRKAPHNCPMSEMLHLSRDCSLALISSITTTSLCSSQPTHTLIFLYIYIFFFLTVHQPASSETRKLAFKRFKSEGDFTGI